MYEILIIEDCIEQANRIRDEYEKVIKELNNTPYKWWGEEEIKIDIFQESQNKKKKNDKEYSFYTDNIYKILEDRIKENKNNSKRTGILLDVSLSEKEYDKAAVNDYTGFEIAKTICEKFQKKTHIYVITSIREFGSQVLSLMGSADFLQRYISKALVIEYPSYGAIARSLYYMMKGQVLSEEEEDKIEMYFLSEKC